jgi:hypothetical protein
VFDPVAPDRVGEAEGAVRTAVRDELPSLAEAIREGRELSDDARRDLLATARTAVQPFTEMADK